MKTQKTITEDREVIICDICKQECDFAETTCYGCGKHICRNCFGNRVRIFDQETQPLTMPQWGTGYALDRVEFCDHCCDLSQDELLRTLREMMQRREQMERQFRKFRDCQDKQAIAAGKLIEKRRKELGIK